MPEATHDTLLQTCSSANSASTLLLRTRCTRPSSSTSSSRQGSALLSQPQVLLLAHTLISPHRECTNTFPLHPLPAYLRKHAPKMSLMLYKWPARAASSMHLLKHRCDQTGGKDSTVLAHILTLLNARHGYGLDLFLLSIDEGITGYRDDSLETVKRNEQQYGIPLKILSYQELYGWTMDEIVRAIGHKNNCTFCGVFRRQALDRGAALLEADRMATGGLTTWLQLSTALYSPFYDSPFDGTLG